MRRPFRLMRRRVVPITPAQVVPRPRNARGAWQLLPPPDSPVVMPLTVQAGPFVEGLATRRKVVVHRPARHREPSTLLTTTAQTPSVVTATGRDEPAEPAGEGRVLTPLPSLRMVAAARSPQPVLSPGNERPGTTAHGEFPLWDKNIVTQESVMSPLQWYGETGSDEQDKAVPGTAVAELPAAAVTQRSSLAASRRLGLGPAYRGPLPEAIRQEHAARAGETGKQEPVPDSVRNQIRAAFGEDVALVRRGPEVDDEAKRHSAQAFTRDGEVFIPDSSGPLDTAQSRPALAHELTHVVQQRRRGGATHPEDSPAGRELEAEAQAVERHVRGDKGSELPNPFAHPVQKQDSESALSLPLGQGAPGMQRQTEPAEATRDSELGNRATGDSKLGALGREFSNDAKAFVADLLPTNLVPETEKPRQDELDRTTNERAAESAGRRFEELRLRHRRSQAEVHGETITEETLHSEIDQELRARYEELTRRVQARLDAIDRHGRDVVAQRGNRPPEPARSIAPADFNRILDRLFGDPDAPMAPDDIKEIDAIGQTGAHQTGASGGTQALSVSGGHASPSASVVPGAGMQATQQEPQVHSWVDLREAVTGDAAALIAGQWGLSAFDTSSSTATASAVSSGGSALAQHPSPHSATAPGATANNNTTTTTQPASEDHHDAEIDLNRLDLDALSAQLYERLRQRLRTELLVDRERAGLLTDFR